MSNTVIFFNEEEDFQEIYVWPPHSIDCDSNFDSDFGYDHGSDYDSDYDDNRR